MLEDGTPPGCRNEKRLPRPAAPVRVSRASPHPMGWAAPEDLRPFLAWQPAVARQPLTGEDWRELGRWFRTHDPAREAITAYRAALQQHPDLPEGWYTLGILLHQQGAYGEALAAFQESLRREPDQIEAWNGLGLAYLALGDRVRGGEVHERLRALDAKLAQRFLYEVLRP